MPGLEVGFDVPCAGNEFRAQCDVLIKAPLPQISSQLVEVAAAHTAHPIDILHSDLVVEL